MEVGIGAGKVWNAGKQFERLTHDVGADRRVQRRKVLVPLHLIDHCGRHRQVVFERGRGAHHAVPNGARAAENRRS